MVVGNKWFYVILGSLFTLLIIVNLVMWSAQMGNGISETGGIYLDEWYTPNKYIGFKNLFDYLGTFPGPAMSYEALNSFCNVFTNFDVTGIVVLDYFIAIFRLITGPVAVLVSTIGDLLLNLLWFAKLILKGIIIGDFFNKPHGSYDMPLN